MSPPLSPGPAEQAYEKLTLGRVIEISSTNNTLPQQPELLDMKGEGK